MTFQLICFCVNLALVYCTFKRNKRITRISEHLKRLQEQITSEYDKLQSIHHQIDRHGRQIKLRFSLDVIDIDRVKDDVTRNYLAVRRLITRFNPN